MKMNKTLLALALLSSAFSVNLLAADIEAGVVKNVVDHSALIQNDTLYFSPSDLQGIEVEAPKLATSVSTRAAAQGITYFEIGAVQSVSYPNIDPVSAN